MIYTISGKTSEAGIKRLAEIMGRNGLTGQVLDDLCAPAGLPMPYYGQTVLMLGSTIYQIAINHSRGDSTQFTYCLTGNTVDVEFGPLRDALLEDEHFKNADSRILR